jgi:hypothetical protein
MNRYLNIPTIKSLSGKQIYATSRYPEIPLSFNDIYVYTTLGDRFDTLSSQFYKDSSLWWIIAIANVNKVKLANITIPEGTQIRIPSNYLNIIENFNQINKL